MSLTRRDKVLDGFFITLIAALFGPPAGGFILGVGFILMVLVIAPFDPGPLSAHMSLAILMQPFLFAIGSYLFGFIPAFFSGLAVSVHAALSGYLSYGMCALHVVWVSFTYAFLLLSTDKWSLGREVVVLGSLFIGCGLVSSFILFRGLGPETKVALKPIPLQGNQDE